MDINTKQFKQHPVRYLELPDRGLLLNTKDVLAVLGISERQKGSDISQSCLDLTSAITVAAGSNDEFAMWLNETFVGYKPETLVYPQCDDNWNFN